MLDHHHCWGLCGDNTLLFIIILYVILFIALSSLTSEAAVWRLLQEVLSDFFCICVFFVFVYFVYFCICVFCIVLYLCILYIFVSVYCFWLSIF